jgi:hypothetical protein
MDRWKICSEPGTNNFANVSVRTRGRKYVVEVLNNNNNWVNDIQGGLSWQHFAEFFRLWDYVQEVTLTEQEDRHMESGI